MALREWMIPHEWMLKPTPQTEWIDRKGILVWMAEVFGSLGPGLYLVSLFFDSLLGMFAGWLIIVFLKLPVHLAYFGKPARFWRVLPPFSNAWRTSWIARGVLITILFVAFTLIHLVLGYFVPGVGGGIAFKVVGGIIALFTAIYSGFVFSYCRSVPFWNSALLPVVFLLVSITDGFALIMAFGLGGAPVDIIAAETGSRIILCVNAILLGAYLWKAALASKTSNYSVMMLLRGRLALPFWGGVVALGIAIPLAVSAFVMLAGEASVPLMIFAVTAHTAGTVALKYCLLKAGAHAPLLTSVRPTDRQNQPSLMQ